MRDTACPPSRITTVPTMFNPSRDEVRRFFIETWRKQRAGEILTPLEAIAADWIV